MSESLTKSEPIENPTVENTFHDLQYLYCHSVQAAVSSVKKKKPSFDAHEVRLLHSQLVLEGKKGPLVIPLNSLCLLQREDLVVVVKSKSTPSLKSLKPKDGPERTLLLCTHDLSRIWLRFESVSQMELWMLSIDGLLSTAYSSSLIEPTQKAAQLRNVWLTPWKGGSIKLGDDEEWTYLGSSGSLFCSMSPDRGDLLAVKFIFDGNNLVPEAIESPYSIGTGEWDGMNLYWYSSCDPTLTERKRKRQAIFAYHFVYEDLEFRQYVDGNITNDPSLTWKLTRNFWARKHAKGGEWIQADGDVPHPIPIFLHLFKMFRTANL